MSTTPNPTILSTDERMTQIERQLAETRNALQTQSEQIAEVLKLLRQPTPISIQPTSARNDAPVSEQISSFVSRRSMLKNAALATLGAAAVFETMPSARAAGGSQGGDLVLGENNSATASTQVSTSAGDGFMAIVTSGSGSALYGSSSAGDGVHGLSTSNNGVSGGSSSGYGVKGTSSTKSGVYGLSASSYGVKGFSSTKSGVYGSSTSGDGVHGISSSNNGVSGGSNTGYGVRGTSPSASGVYGVCTSTTDSSIYLGGVTGNGVSCTGVIGMSQNGVGAGVGVFGVSGTGYGVWAQSNTGSGLYAISTATTGSGYGVVAASKAGSALYGNGAAYGAVLAGTAGPLYLASGGLNDPNAGNSGRPSGVLYVDVSGGLWYCVENGTPGTWRQVATSATAGSFVFLSAPTRFIDTRSTSPSFTSNQAPLSPGEIAGITFSGAGAVKPYVPPNTMGPTPVIPYGATGLTGRITVLSGESGPTVGGILRVSNIFTDPLGFGSGLVQWKTTPENQIAPFALALNNTQVPGSGVIYFENSSSADTIDLIVDVTGYYY